jgi:hypothetical protein
MKMNKVKIALGAKRERPNKIVVMDMTSGNDTVCGTPKIYNLFLKSGERSGLSDIGTVFVKDYVSRYTQGEEIRGAFEIVSSIHYREDLEPLSLDKFELMQIKTLRSRSDALYDKLTKKGKSWDWIRNSCRYRMYRNDISEIVARAKSCYKPEVVGIASRKEGAIYAARNIALRKAGEIAGVLDANVEDQTDMNYYYGKEISKRDV